MTSQSIYPLTPGAYIWPDIVGYLHKKRMLEKMYSTKINCSSCFDNLSLNVFQLEILLVVPVVSAFFRQACFNYN